MPACPTCGAENPADNEFCTSCGKPIGPATLDGLLEAGIVCPDCDTYNDASAKKCVRCGTSLAGMTEFLSAVDLPSEKTVVEPKPQGLPEPAPAAKTQPQAPAISVPQQPAPAAKTQPQAPAVSVPQQPTQPAPVQKPPHRPTDQMPAAVGSTTDSNVCPHCRAKLPVGAVFCLACGKKLAKTEPIIEAVSNLSVRLRLTRGYGREDSTFRWGRRA